MKTVNINNKNPLYYLYGFAVKDAVEDEQYTKPMNAADIRNAVIEHPTRCIKALHLRRQEDLKGKSDVLVLRTTVLLKAVGNKFWTRFVDGARTQVQFDDEGRRQDVNTMFVLHAPSGVRSHTQLHTHKGTGAPRRQSSSQKVPNMTRIQVLKKLIKDENDTD